jgi:hypothetical protein
MVETDRGTTYQLVILIPGGATRLRSLTMHFDWLEQGRDSNWTGPS